MGHKDVQAAEEITGRHDRDDLFRDRGDTAHSSEEDEAADRRDDDADKEAVHAESIVEGIGDRIRLHHITDKTESHDDGHREEYRKAVALEAA
ncbi:hypothetical protein SDC9_123570 [bioreactor metagenome]|uniref:Uncharacterized protein n=1 Tax=bioreactor metagenome TaxID=1076179 RepID=A0A645CI10_9ZZZZ